MARGDQLVRQWSILHRLRQGPRTRRELAQEFGVSLKTIQRDIDALSLFPIVEEHRGIEVHYALIGESHMPGIWLEHEELSALLFASKMVLDTLQKTPFYEAFEGLLQKVERLQKLSAHRARKQLPEVFQVFASSQRTLRRIDEATLKALLDAAMAGQCVWIRYFTASRQALTERVVEPYILYQSPHGFRLIGYCQLRQEIRLFNINQIRALEPRPERFEPDSRRGEVEQYLAESFDDMRSEPILDVRLHIAYPTAHWAKDRFFHVSQEIVEVSDGIEVRFRAGGMPAIAACVMGVGPDCYVLSPPALQEMVVQRARDLLKMYGSQEK